MKTWMPLSRTRTDTSTTYSALVRRLACREAVDESRLDARVWREELALIDVELLSWIEVDLAVDFPFHAAHFPPSPSDANRSFEEGIEGARATAGLPTIRLAALRRVRSSAPCAEHRGGLLALSCAAGRAARGPDASATSPSRSSVLAPSAG
jgi:hypothetical protein